MCERCVSWYGRRSGTSRPVGGLGTSLVWEIQGIPGGEVVVDRSRFDEILVPSVVAVSVLGSVARAQLSSLRMPSSEQLGDVVAASSHASSASPPRRPPALAAVSTNTGTRSSTSRSSSRSRRSSRCNSMRTRSPSCSTLSRSSQRSTGSVAVEAGPEGFGYRLRPVERRDAADILELRTDPELGRFLQPDSWRGGGPGTLDRGATGPCR